MLDRYLRIVLRYICRLNMIMAGCVMPLSVGCADQRTRAEVPRALAGHEAGRLVSAQVLHRGSHSRAGPSRRARVSGSVPPGVSRRLFQPIGYVLALVLPEPQLLPKQSVNPHGVFVYGRSETLDDPPRMVLVAS